VTIHRIGFIANGTGVSFGPYADHTRYERRPNVAGGAAEGRHEEQKEHPENNGYPINDPTDYVREHFSLSRRLGGSTPKPERVCRAIMSGLGSNFEKANCGVRQKDASLCYGACHSSGPCTWA